MKKLFLLSVLLLAGCATKPAEPAEPAPVVIVNLDNGPIGAADMYAFKMFPAETRPFSILGVKSDKK